MKSLLSVPESIEDEAMATFRFAKVFETRYGRCHPAFLQGSLDDAITQACKQPARDVIYSFFNGKIY